MDAPTTTHDRNTAVHVEDWLISAYLGHLPSRLYRPSDDANVLPVVLYLHGGGFVAGSLDDADATARQLVERAGVAVLSLAYSLAPHHPFPAAPEDAHAALRWLLGAAAGLNLDSRRLAVAGDDAGGNIAAAAALIARDRNGPALAAQVLIGPMLDPSMTLLGDAERLTSDLKPQTCAQRYAQYLPHSQERLHPYASPLASRRLHELPPTYLATAKCDVLHREAEAYATALIAAGVPTQITRFDVQHEALPRHPPLLAEAAEFLRQRLHSTSSNKSQPRRK
ncbi:alpha/beta hydrolase [Azovibrio restrictus]|uniref:alpha/beta hydrolase n=1 Tax=Azovibrio restrictus TaxID=146938 RepID=UPI0026F1AF81|nr:alpha/beta hydrolase [Azovibrio restrictus]MDD3482735.1 alpha/beta hydrolase [Azovibrio restrictus]